MSVTPLYKGKIILKLGLVSLHAHGLRTPDADIDKQYDKLPSPEWESFAEQRQTWESPLEGTMQFRIKSLAEKMPGSPEKAGPAKN